MPPSTRAAGARLTPTKRARSPSPPSGQEEEEEERIPLGALAINEPNLGRSRQRTSQRCLCNNRACKQDVSQWGHKLQSIPGGEPALKAALKVLLEGDNVQIEALLEGNREHKFSTADVKTHHKWWKGQGGKRVTLLFRRDVDDFRVYRVWWGSFLSRLGMRRHLLRNQWPQQQRRYQHPGTAARTRSYQRRMLPLRWDFE
jgi:hypothetical protein